MHETLLIEKYIPKLNRQLYGKYRVFHLNMSI